MSTRRTQYGFTAFEGVIIVLVVAVLAAAGYMVYSRMNNTASKTSSTSDQATSTTPTAPAVNNTSDLDTASKTLDDTNVDATVSDTAQLDSELNQF